MTLTKLDRIILTGVILALITGISANYFGSVNHLLERIIGVLVLFVISTWLIILLSRAIFYKLTDGELAVEAFILNSNKELLLYKHPFHNKFIPVGGRVKRSEFPDKALERRLLERAGLARSAYHYNNVFHPDFNTSPFNLGHVQRIPSPFIIQKELRRQRLFKKFHYDFIYVIDLLDDKHVFPSNDYSPFRFVNLSMLSQLRNSNETFPDVLDTYDRILPLL